MLFVAMRDEKDHIIDFVMRAYRKKHTWDHLVSHSR
ncbi:MAG: hypothetical protein A4E39_00597 [Methanoregulaceae archaeon PtaB.Bin152]|nr:MAG: hypothetical protein A4E39_00597 [Methanoregulaceae archaeon PtaB.Bin152]